MSSGKWETALLHMTHISDKDVGDHEAASTLFVQQHSSRQQGRDHTQNAHKQEGGERLGRRCTNQSRPRHQQPREAAACYRGVSTSATCSTAISDNNVREHEIHLSLRIVGWYPLAG